MVSKESFLRSVDGLHPDIPLKNLEKVDIGRGPKTKIKDPRCSRSQVALTANLGDSAVTCRQMGGNPSKVAGGLLKVGESVLLRHRDIIELLPGQYRYSVIFNPPPDPHSETKPEKVKVSDGKTLDIKSKDIESKSAKRKVSDGESSENQLIELKKRRTDSNSQPLPWFKPETGTIISSKNGVEWLSVYERMVLVLRTENCKPSDKVAAFDLDGTIITTQSGKVFPVDKNDWKILYPEIPGKLKSLHSEGYKILFITNQSGIAKGKLKEEDFREKAERISAKLGVPLQLICCCADGGFFRKPRPGLWFWFENIGNSGAEIKLDESFYCGDAAGREANWVGKRKKDFSCSDRLFAMNIGLKFYTPEEYFQGHAATSKFTLPGFDPRIESTTSLLEPETEPFTKDSQEMIIMVGIQGSGKSHVSARLERSGYVVASNDRSGGKEKTLKIVRDGLEAGRRVVVDNTHRDKDSRKDYLVLAKRAGVPVRCFLMNTSHDQARHNNIYRELTDPSHTRIKEMLFNSYRSKFEEPTVSEGFTSIVRVNFVPSFPDQNHADLYKMFLLEK